MESDPVVWKTDEENQWCLYSNSDAKLPQIAPSKTNTKTHSKGGNQIDSPFYFNKLRAEAKGSVIYTPKGYGIIQAYLPDTDTTSVKVEGTVYDFEKREIMNEIPIQVFFMKDSTKVLETIMMPISSTTSDLITRVENSCLQEEEEGNDVKLYYKGKELEKTVDSLEKLKIIPHSKFLALPTLGKPLYMNRFPTINEGWYYDQSSIDGVCITPSKRIKLKGFSVYRGTKGAPLNATVEIIQGDNTKGSILYSESFNVERNSGGTDEKIYQVMLKKTLTFDEGSSFSLTFRCQGGQTFYGSGGITPVTGEGGVTFTFKECTGAHNGTSASSGQFPELFYYA